MLDLRGIGQPAIPADPGSYRCDRLMDDVMQRPPRVVAEFAALFPAGQLGGSAGARFSLNR
jgi:hypothetical protein